MDVTITRNKSVHDALDNLIADGDLIGKIGWTADAVHVNPRTGVKQPVATTAALNEDGYVNIYKGKIVAVPARPMFGITIRREAPNWIQTMTRGAQLTLDGVIDWNEALEAVTKEAVVDVRDTVRNRVPPPLSPITLRLRAENSVLRGGPLSTGTTPLHDTGYMMDTLTNEVTTE